MPSCSLRCPIRASRVLATAAELAREGEEMQHCLAEYARDVESGDLVAVGLRYGDERLTATAIAIDGALVLDHLAGRANKPASVAARAVVERWLGTG